MITHFPHGSPGNALALAFLPINYLLALSWFAVPLEILCVQWEAMQQERTTFRIGSKLRAPMIVSKYTEPSCGLRSLHCLQYDFFSVPEEGVAFTRGQVRGVKYQETKEIAKGRTRD